MRFARIECSKTRLRPVLRPGPRWGSLQRSPDPLAGFKSRGERRGRERAERGREGGEGMLTLMRSWNRVADWLRPAVITELKTATIKNIIFAGYRLNIVVLWSSVAFFDFYYLRRRLAKRRRYCDARRVSVRRVVYISRIDCTPH